MPCPEGMSAAKHGTGEPMLIELHKLKAPNILGYIIILILLYYFTRTNFFKKVRIRPIDPIPVWLNQHKKLIGKKALSTKQF